jgi:LexA-binding, inner membrane-associated putative hydrolase
MGPGLLVKSLLQGSFSLLVFGWTQIIMDIQPLIVLITGNGHLHGFTHTFLGATLIGIASGLTGKYAGEFGLRVIDQTKFSPISWTVAFTSAFIGSFSHVVLDGIMHDDVQPLAPFGLSNPFLRFITVDALHKFCLYSGLVGATLYFLVLAFLRKKSRSEKLAD